MLSLFERHYGISWLITILIALVIFFNSSMSFGKNYSIGAANASIYHAVAFFFFSFFLLIAMVKGKNKSFVILGILLALVYAGFDEVHQFFIPYRSPSFSDFLLDSLGVFSASFIYLLSLRLRK